MLIAIYLCLTDAAVADLLDYADPGESMTVDRLLGTKALVTYRSPYLRQVATEDLPDGVALLYQHYEPKE